MNKISPIQEELCIRVPKVYDWVTRQADIEKTFKGTQGLADLEFECNNGFTPEADPCFILNGANDHNNLGVNCDHLNVDCIITDAFGHPVDPEAPGGIICKEITDPRNRESVSVNLDGESTTLQKVKVLKKGFFVIRVSNGNEIICTSAPQSFSTVEKFFLCAPPGTKLQCEISHFQCEAVLCCREDDTFSQLVVHINMCQNIQMEAQVKLQITADFCQPRQEIPFDCPAPQIPQQCFFPISDIRDISGKVCKPQFVSFGPNQSVTQVISITPIGIANVTLETIGGERGIRVHCIAAGTTTAVVTVRNDQTGQTRNVTLRISCT
ncbi:hypothetical protein BTR23_16085 [Alkalihalophilus pseudofirmus]|nr:hypothetical protein BTR23_16085 [Alkalihalophilus pseudofirmus]